MNNKITIPDTEHLHKAAQQFIKHFNLDTISGSDAPTCFAFYAPMGAGKTTFIKAICEELGVQDVITSPTFAIVNEYTDANGAPIYHFDFYRIKRQEELFDMGADEYFYSGNLCFMEWPELVEDALPDDVVRIAITPQPDGTRLVEW